MIKFAAPEVIKVNSAEEFVNVIVKGSLPYGLYRVWEEDNFTCGDWGNGTIVRIDGNKKKEILRQIKYIRRNNF